MTRPLLPSASHRGVHRNVYAWWHLRDLYPPQSLVAPPFLETAAGGQGAPLLQIGKPLSVRASAMQRWVSGTYSPPPLDRKGSSYQDLLL